MRRMPTAAAMQPHVRRRIARNKKRCSQITALAALVCLAYIFYAMMRSSQEMKHHLEKIHAQPNNMTDKQRVDDWLALESFLNDFGDPNEPILNKTYVGPYLSPTAACHIPDLPPRPASVLPFLRPAPPVVCSARPPLTYTLATQTGRQVLVVDEEVALRHYTSQMRCCYSVVTRETEDDNRESACINFERSALVGADVDFIFVSCRHTRSHQQLYANMHAVVQVKPTQQAATALAKMRTIRPLLVYNIARGKRQAKRPLVVLYNARGKSKAVRPVLHATARGKRQAIRPLLHATNQPSNGGKIQPVKPLPSTTIQPSNIYKIQANQRSNGGEFRVMRPPHTATTQPYTVGKVQANWSLNSTTIRPSNGGKIPTIIPLHSSITQPSPADKIQDMSPLAAPPTQTKPTPHATVGTVNHVSPLYALPPPLLHATGGNMGQAAPPLHALPTRPTVIPHAATGDEGRPPLHAMKPNVLLLGIDSMSRLNLLRTMPRTVAYLHAAAPSPWLPLRMFNKVGDNTIPNLMAVLTGLDETQLRARRCWHGHHIMDDCPFIWRRFRERGYVTAYAEDEPPLATFNYGQAGGFRSPPTDYYLRPFMLAAQEKLPRVKRDDLTICLGPVAVTDILLKYARDLLSTFPRALFALVWLNNFSHHDHNTPAAMDDRFLNFLRDSEADRNNTIVVFFSDHGVRHGDIRYTYTGWLEERLPFVYISLPAWFQAAFPEAHQNLRDNQDRLTSPYDLHLTLRDLLEGLEGSGDRGGSQGCPTCVSLFTPVAENRICAEAGVTAHWCACADMRDASTARREVRRAALYALRAIRRRLAGFNKCATLRLKEVLSARLKEDNDVYQEYVIVFETMPGLAVFDATVRYWLNMTSFHEEHGTVLAKLDSTAPNWSNITPDHDGKSLGLAGLGSTVPHWSNITSLQEDQGPGLAGLDSTVPHWSNITSFQKDQEPGLAGLDSTVTHWSNMTSLQEGQEPGLAGLHSEALNWSNIASRFEVLGMISRINSYEGQSRCMPDKELKLYCFCIRH